MDTPKVNSQTLDLVDADHCILQRLADANGQTLPGFVLLVPTKVGIRFASRASLEAMIVTLGSYADVVFDSAPPSVKGDG